MIADFRSCSDLEYSYMAGAPVTGLRGTITTDCGLAFANYVEPGLPGIIDGRVFETESDEDIVVGRLSAEGHIMWARQLTSPGAFSGNRRATAAVTGEIFVALQHDGPGPVSDGEHEIPTPTGLSLVLLRYDPEGALSWASTWPATDVYPERAAVGATGNVYVALDVDEDRVLPVDWAPSSPQPFNEVIARLDGPSGDIVWSRSIGGVGIVHDMFEDASGSLVIAGLCQDGVDFGSGPIALPGALVGSRDRQVFVAKYGPDGAFGWVQVLPIIYDASVLHFPSIVELAHKSTGLVVAFVGTIRIGGAVMTTTEGPELAFVRLSEAGDVDTARSLGTMPSSVSDLLSLTPLLPLADDTVLMHASFSEGFRLGTHDIDSASITDSTLVRLRSDGTILNHFELRAVDGFARVRQVSTSDGALLVTGELRGRSRLGGTELASEMGTGFAWHVPVSALFGDL